VTRYALVEELLTMAATAPSLRRSLPFGIDLADPDAISPQLAETVAALRDWLLSADPSEVADRLRERFWPGDRPAPLRPLAQAAFLAGLDGDSLVTVRPGLRWRLSSDQPGRVTLRTFDRTLTMPDGCTPALGWLLDGATHRVADTPGLDEVDDALVLTRRLVREAVLVPGPA